MISFQLPKTPALLPFIEKERLLPFTYSQHGATAAAAPVPGFDNDSHRVKIGSGDQDFEKAKSAIRAWKMFPAGWTIILP